MADTEVEVKMTDEEVHALTSDELIEMVGNNENIPYEQMTDEQLDLMEEIMAAFMASDEQMELEAAATINEEDVEVKVTSKQRILRGVNKIDSTKFSKFSGTGASEGNKDKSGLDESSLQKRVKSKYESKTIKKMDMTKKNMFVKRHDMRQRMIEPSTVIHVRKLKSHKMDFLSEDPEKDPVDKEVEIGRLKLKEFFGIEEESAKGKQSEVSEVKKLNVQEFLANLSSNSAGEQQEKENEKPQVKKLNIKEAFNPDAQTGEDTQPKEQRKIGKLNRSHTFASKTHEDDDENGEGGVRVQRTESLSVKKMDISKRFPAVNGDQSDKPVEKEKVTVGKINSAALFQNQNEEGEDSKGAEKQPTPGKLNTASLFQQNENSEDSKSDKPTPGKLNAAAMFQQTEDSEGSKASEKLTPGKLNTSALFQQNEEDNFKNTEKPTPGKLNAAAMFQQNEESDKSTMSEKPTPGKINTAALFENQTENELPINSEKPANVGKLNVGEFLANSDGDKAEQKPKVDVGRLDISAVFVPDDSSTPEKSNKPAVEVKKLDISAIMAQQEEGGTQTTKEKENIPEAKKLNLNEFLQSNAEVKLDKEVPVSVGKIDLGSLRAAAIGEEEGLEGGKEKERKNVGKLDTSKFLQPEGDEAERKEKEKPVVGKIQADSIKFDAHKDPQEVTEETEVGVGKLNVSLDMFVRGSAEEEEERLRQSKLERQKTISKIDTSALFVSEADAEAEREREEKKKIEVGKLNLNLGKETFETESEQKLRQLREEKESRLHSIQKIDTRTLTFDNAEIDEDKQKMKIERPVQVNKLNITEEQLFAQSEQENSGKEKQTVGKIDKTKLDFSISSTPVKRTAEDAPTEVKKLNVTEAMFQATSGVADDDDGTGKQGGKVKRSNTVGKMDASRYKLKSGTEEEGEGEGAKEKGERRSVGKLNVGGLFNSQESERELEDKKKRSQKKNLQELLQVEKELSKLNPVDPGSMHAQHKKGAGSRKSVQVEGEEYETIEDECEAESVTLAHTAPSNMFLDNSDGANQKLEVTTDTPAVEGGGKGESALTNGDSQKQPTSASPNQTPPSAAAQKVAANVGSVDASQMCVVCGKRVYETERISVNSKGASKVYHKSCFRCAQCNRVLSMGTYCLSVNGEVYCKPHFQQLFKVKGSYNIESSSGALRDFHQSSAENAANLSSQNGGENGEGGRMNNGNHEDEDDEVSLPDLKSLKSRFESVANGESQEMVVIDRDNSSASSPTAAANVSSLKNQWANNAVGRSESVRMKDDEVQLCRSASQLRAQFDKPNQHMTTATAQDNTPDGTESSEDPKAQEVMCVSGGLASVKSMFEGGNRNAQQPSGRQVAQDESLQAAMARSSISSKTIFQSGGAEPSNDDSDTTANKSQVYEDESLLAARQGRKGLSAKSVFENTPQDSSASTTTNVNTQNEELAAIRASRGTNLRAMFEGGAAAGGSSEQVHIDNSQSGGTGTGEDESLAAARARRGVSNKAMFESSSESTTTVVRTTNNDTAGLQAGKAKDLLSKFESGQVETTSDTEDDAAQGDKVVEIEACLSRPSPSMMTMLFEDPANWAKKKPNATRPTPPVVPPKKTTTTTKQETTKSSSNSGGTVITTKTTTTTTSKGSTGSSSQMTDPNTLQNADSGNVTGHTQQMNFTRQTSSGPQQQFSHHQYHQEFQPDPNSSSMISSSSYTTGSFSGEVYQQQSQSFYSSSSSSSDYYDMEMRGNSNMEGNMAEFSNNSNVSPHLFYSMAQQGSQMPADFNQMQMQYLGLTPIEEEEGQVSNGESGGGASATEAETVVASGSARSGKAMFEQAHTNANESQATVNGGGETKQEVAPKDG
ncbi:serine-rich adhesin for platelets-like isoform X3 [Symsagittifera roscoffensis]|uniref:serine-rich adhesin for platelets-like isoform X3 n=1 Tax=Symsagittifera roscoffensis TaxID=84072 RepID=UPI00307CC3CF